MMRLLIRAFALLVVLFAPQGCIILGFGVVVGAGVGAYAARDIRVKVGASIKVEFESPRDATLVGGGGRDTTLLAGMTMLIGRVRDMRGDTLWVTVSEANTSTAQRVRYDRRRAPEAVVVHEPGVSVEPLGSQLASIVTGGALGAGAAVLYVFGYCALNPCFN